MYTNEQLIRSFNHGERLELNVNISNDPYFGQYINSLAWYHNGTKVTSGNKYIINGNTTMLTVLNMTESDAGTYEVKINSIDYLGYDSSQECNSRLLPLLESLALFAPVSFVVGECSPVYDPNAVISDYYITDHGDNISRNVVLSINSTLLQNLSASELYRYWYKDGIRINDGDVFNSNITHENGLVSSTLQITYNNTDDITGHYVGVILIQRGYRYMRAECRAYYYFLRDYYYYFNLYEPYSEVMYWSVNVYSKLILHPFYRIIKLYYFRASFISTHVF